MLFGSIMVEYGLSQEQPWSAFGLRLKKAKAFKYDQEELSGKNILYNNTKANQKGCP